jgi:hypothetical protein
MPGPPAIFSPALGANERPQTSNGFFQASKSLGHLSETLDATCNVNFASCNSLMGSLANQLVSSDNCGADYSLQNPLVTQAHNGFIAYGPMYYAGCLNSSTPLNISDESASDSDISNPYCYAVAVLSPTANSADSYIYSLPLGMPLPGGSRPTCDQCLKQTMAIFAAAASNATQPVSTDYSEAASLINSGCGPSFVNATAQSPPSGGPASARGPGAGWIVGLVAASVAVAMAF